ncbi:MAG: hypothetical protein LV479_09875 [Methylacidiphilales bacterium]|nr:hypothetical protein [Candidatus Methylacidiphilales bacterium]
MRTIRDLPSYIEGIKRRIKKVFVYGELSDKLALAEAMAHQVEFYKFELKNAKIERTDNLIKQKQSEIEGLSSYRAKLEKQSHPFHAFIDDDPLPSNNAVSTPSTINGSNHTVTVGANTRKGHSRKKIVLDRSEVMKKIGYGLIRTKELASFFHVAPATFREKAKELKIPTRGELSAMVYITDEQDGFKCYRGLSNTPPPEITKKEPPKRESMLDAGKRLLEEQKNESDDEVDKTFEQMLSN